MSIVQSIDAEISGVNEEIAALEAQLDGKRGRLDKLNELREQAASLNGEGGGLPDPAPAPAPAPKPAPERKPATSTGGGRAEQAKRLWAEREATVLELLAAAGAEGLSPAELRQGTGFAKEQVEKVMRLLLAAEKVSAEGTRKSRRYFVEGADRPSPAPTPEGRAASAPARRTHARRETEAAAVHNALRNRVKAAVLQILEEGPPAGIGKDRLTAAVLEAVPEATPDDVTGVRVALTKNQGSIETRANKICLTGVDRTKPITAVEWEVVGCLGSGRTVKEVEANCQLVRSAFTARTILAALEQRGVVKRRPDSSPPVYEPVDQEQEVAA